MRVLVRTLLMAASMVGALSGLGATAVAAPAGAAGNVGSATTPEGARANPADQRACVVSADGQRCYDTVAAGRRAEGLADNQTRKGR